MSRQVVDMPLHYSVEFRREVCELDVGLTTLDRWRRQALIDVGRAPGVLSYEVDRLAQARRRVKELEAELAMTRAASELFNQGGGDPKGDTRLFEG